MARKIEAEEARQGRRGTPVLRVLVIALILAAIVWFGTEWYGQAIDSTPEATQQTQPAG